jgi:protein tyrosine/serine phosphatase
MRVSLRPIIVAAAAVLAAPAVTLPARAQSRHSTTVAERLLRPDLSRIRIDNFGCINPSYYRGAQPRGHDYANLAAIGVRTLIDLTSEDVRPDEKVMAERSGMTYVRIPMTTHTPPTDEVLDAFLRIVTDPSRQPVFVHCVGGRHRTGVMTAVYRMFHDGWNADQAYQEMRHYKFGADFLHREFKELVYRYQPALAGTR